MSICEFQLSHDENVGVSIIIVIDIISVFFFFFVSGSSVLNICVACFEEMFTEEINNYVFQEKLQVERESNVAYHVVLLFPSSPHTVIINFSIIY